MTAVRDPYQQYTEALDILRTATPDTPPTLAAWAVGVALGQHAISVSEQWGGIPIVAHEPGGHSLEHGTIGRYLDHGRGRAAVVDRLDDGKKQTILTVTAADVAAVLDRRRVPADLVAEVDASLVARRAHVAAGEPFWKRRPLEWHHARNAEWDRIEDRCQAAGAAVWAAVRPTAFAQQLDLFATAYEGYEGGAR